MEGIPPEDIREHEKQKNGNRSESDDDEPAVKKTKPEIPTVQPGMMMPNMMPPHLAQFGMPPMMQMQMPPGLGAYMMPPGMPMMPPMLGGGARPLFPAAATVSTASLNQKATFPAYR